ncbi:uncharacterized protein PHACADRAFT_257635 [Phanerochaete carnosa HHB-10118-sp]|uniref:Uncharacterized protein n=1 Tax=Phanerochaete carnosa (strain HHB-10118-sp) TaxID=650164 RepID=K5W523_PHACS|nr:uncharacterized protein PHACADRAFT_257635 [Phanerochaete carnosa HHB-10118-sp]EKM54044.1 hypothetical protein PHACADRAFT_257635 [Phanerochaete carnosa HHB-10118-sp]
MAPAQPTEATEPPVQARPSAPHNDKSGSDTSERPMELSTPPETAEDVPMNVEKGAQNVSAPDETPTTFVSRTTDGGQNGAMDGSSPKGAPQLLADESNGALIKSHGAPSQVKDDTMAGTAIDPAESSKNARAPTHAPADSKPPPSSVSPPETEKLPEENEPPQPASSPAENPGVRPPEPAHEDEKEEGELSEDG